nr:uncharacterized protein LOC123747182 [Procambarus clarkii]
MKTGNVIPAKGNKIVENEGNIPAHNQEYILSSANFKYHVDMVIHSPYELGENLLADLTKYLYSMVDSNTVSYVSNKLWIIDVDTVIYNPGNIRRFNSIEHALQAFCHPVDDSEVCKHPFSTYLIKSVPFTSMGSSYASVLKGSKSESKEINFTLVPKTHQDQTHRNLTIETKNQVIRSENISKCEENQVNDKKDCKMQEDTNSWFRRDSKNVCIENVQTYNSSKCYYKFVTERKEKGEENFEKKGKKISLTGELQELVNERKLQKDIQLSEVHVSQYASRLPKDTIYKSKMAIDNAKYSAISIGSDRKGDKYIKGNIGFDNDLHYKSRVPKTMYIVQTQNICFEDNAPKDYEEFITMKAQESPVQTLHNTKVSEHKLQDSKVLDTLFFEREIDICGSGDSEINLDKAVVKSDTQKYGSFEFHQNDNGNEVEKNFCYPISHITKQVQDSHSQSDCSSSGSKKRTYNSDLKNKSRLSVNEICNSKTVKSKENISDNSNISKDKFQGHFELGNNEDKEDFSLTLGYLKPEEEVLDECGMMRKYYGVRSEIKQKTIIILGASGSGKTTLVNFVANYFKGVKSADGELVHVVRNSNDVRSYTTSITAYTFCFGEHDTPITIIDTPGLNDSSGAEVRDHVQSLKTFLANAASQNYEIHAIGFVAQAHLVRLTSSERLVMDYVSTLFGQGIENHFFTFVTFADNQETPPVVEAMRSYGMKCNTFFKFNNSPLSNNKTDEIDDLDRVYWRIGNKSWKKFMKSLHNLPALPVITLKTLQNEVFTSTVVESAERALRAELKIFINYCNEGKCMTKEELHSRDKVWELASIVHHLRSNQMSNSMSTECILMSFAEEVCKEHGTLSKSDIRLLFLAPSRKLLNAGIGVIQSIAPLYKHAIKNIIEQRQLYSKTTPNIIFCNFCESNHALERVQLPARRLFSFFGSNPMDITYRCVKCPCDGDAHGESPEDDSTECLTNNLDLNKLLEHTRLCLTDIATKFSIQGYFINIDDYLQYINNVTNYEFDNFINDLLQMTLKGM